MSSIALKPFHELSDFQQWALFHIIIRKKISRDIETEMPNFCDTTQNNIDFDNYDRDISRLSSDLRYFISHKIMEGVGSNQLYLTNKGKLYCSRYIQKELEKLSDVKLSNALTNEKFYAEFQQLFSFIIRNKASLEDIANAIIGNKKIAMSYIHAFNKMIKWLIRE